MRDILAADGAAIIWTEHSKERMLERDITTTQVIRCLEKGTMCEQHYYDTVKANWKFTVVHTTAGREVCAVVALNLNDKVLVITVY